jgi:hypothetical protein
VSTQFIGPFRSRVESVRRRIEESQLNAVRELLPDSQVLAACRDADEIALLYAGRWKVETLIRELKAACGADVLRSKKPDGVRKELAARLAAMNMVRTLMIEAALAHGEEPSAPSFSNAMRLVTATSQKMSEAPVRRLRGLYEEMLAAIAAETVPERPGRNEPRAIAREKQHYPRLGIKRADWRRRHAG